MDYLDDAAGNLETEQVMRLLLICLSSALLLSPSVAYATEGSIGGVIKNIVGFIFACIFWSVFKFFLKMVRIFCCLHAINTQIEKLQKQGEVAMKSLCQKFVSVTHE